MQFEMPVSSLKNMVFIWQRILSVGFELHLNLTHLFFFTTSSKKQYFFSIKNKIYLKGPVFAL